MLQRIARPLMVVTMATVVALAAVCTGGSAKGATPALTPIVLPVAANAGYAPWDVALAKGYFANHGLDVKLKTFDNGVAGTQAMIAGDVQAGGTVAMPLVSNLAQGADIVVTAVWFTGHELRLVTRTGINKPADLAGRTVGLQVGGINDYALQRYLQKNGVDKRSVKIVNVTGADMVAGLARGDLDAIVNEEPIVSKALAQLGDKVHILSPAISDVTIVRNFLQFDRKWATQHPDLVKAIMASLRDANTFIQSDPQGAAALAAKRVGVDAKTLASWWADGQITWPLYLNDIAVKDLSDVAQWMYDNKLVNTLVDTSKVFDPSYLKAIDPAAVTLGQ
jgi:NitT/TauT family transport system substrate-binding protein